VFAGMPIHLTLPGTSTWNLLLERLHDSLPSSMKKCQHGIVVSQFNILQFELLRRKFFIIIKIILVMAMMTTARLGNAKEIHQA
jgi:hypothetical protein